MASKKFEGRESGTEGQQKAANYIRKFYKRNGVEPGNGDSYFQEFEVKERNGTIGGMSSNVLGSAVENGNADLGVLICGRCFYQLFHIAGINHFSIFRCMVYNLYPGVYIQYQQA